MSMTDWRGEFNTIDNIATQLHSVLYRRVTQKKYAKELTSIFESKFDLPKKSLPIVFIDSHYNRSIPEGKIFLKQISF